MLQTARTSHISESCQPHLATICSILPDLLPAQFIARFSGTRVQMDEEEKLRRLTELKQRRDEIDRVLSELARPEVSQTNIPYAAEFTAAHPLPGGFDSGSYDPEELLQIKRLVNKRCNQMSTDFTHASTLIESLVPYRGNRAFAEIFARKLLEQGRVLVAGHLEAYKPLSYALHKLDDAGILQIYTGLMIRRPEGEAEMRGMYAIYFGYLKFRGDVPACWLWVASVLNCRPNALSGYVLEVFLVVCGEMLRDRCRGRFMKILRYVLKFYVKELANPPIELRITALAEKLLAGA